MAASYFKVKPQGQTLVVDITTPNGTRPTTVYTDSGFGTGHTFPVTITADTDFYFNLTGRLPYDLEVAQLDGSVLYSARHEADPDKPVIVSPEPSFIGLAVDTGEKSPESYLGPTGSLAETFPRRSVTGQNLVVLVSGRLHLSAVYLPAGTVVTSITYLSGATAAGTPTAQWFALYDSARGLLAQTTDDTTTAWAANSTKTLALTSPFTTTYSGLHYVGINVTATTAPTSIANSANIYTQGLVPISNGTSTTGLTTTAPATAAALTAFSSIPYAYLT